MPCQPIRHTPELITFQIYCKVPLNCLLLRSDNSIAREKAAEEEEDKSEDGSEDNNCSDEEEG